MSGAGSPPPSPAPAAAQSGVVVTAERPCAAWAADMLKTFEGATMTYLKGPGVERGAQGDEGVPVTWP